jgi:hypothetical protein
VAQAVEVLRHGAACARARACVRVCDVVVVDELCGVSACTGPGCVLVWLCAACPRPARARPSRPRTRAARAVARRPARLWVEHPPARGGVHAALQAAARLGELRLQLRAQGRAGWLVVLRGALARAATHASAEPVTP